MSDPVSYRSSHSADGFGKHYDSLLANKYDGPAWERLSKPIVLSLLQRELESGSSRYLDFACGTGRITSIGAQVFPQATAIDISPAMVEVARSHSPDCNYIIADITENPNALHGPFDCVTAFRFFLNAEDDLRHEALRWLAANMPSGSALIGNIHMNPYSASGFISSLAVRFRSSKVNTMSRSQATNMLELHGFHLESWRGFRIIPTIRGKPVLPLPLQLRADGILARMGLGWFGVDQLFVARRK